MKELKVTEKKLGRQKAAGQAWKEDREIEIDPRQSSYDYLDTMLHEWTHIEHPEWPERKVAAYSRKLAKFLWKQKYRKVTL